MTIVRNFREVLNAVFAGACVMALVLMSAGCAKGPEPAPAPKQPDPKPVVDTPAPSDGLVWTQMAWPTGDKRTSGLWIQKGMPATVALNQEFEYVIKVMNLTNMELIDVNIWDQLPEGFELVGSEPMHDSADGGKLHWHYNKMSPLSTQVIKVRGKATQLGSVLTCATCNYNAQLCLATKVVEAKLVLEKTMTPEALQCDPIAGTITVRNTGSGAATNVKIEDKLPDGLLTADGKNVVNINVGTLGAGQSKTYPLDLKATKAGSFTNPATASGDGGLKAEASAKTIIRKPVLKLVQDCPKRAYLGRVVCNDLEVSNTGDGVAKDTVLVVDVPAGTSLTDAGGGTAEGNRVTFNLGDLAPDASKKVTVCYKPATDGDYKVAAAAKAYCAEAVASTCETSIEGIPAILLEVIDVNDPVEVGKTETYIITATNQGSDAGRNVSIKVTLEDEAEYVNSDGSATAGTSEGKTVTFAPLESLPVGGKATWRVVVKAVASGDVRFKVEMNEMRLTRPVNETEATNFYE